MQRQTVRSDMKSLSDIARPLPAEEQIAQIFHLFESEPPPYTSEDREPYQAHALQDAYRVCRDITRHHSKSFFFSTLFLPPEKRKAILALYAFCRTSDDTVDMAEGDPALALIDWIRKVRRLPTVDEPVLLAWYDTRTRYNLSLQLVDELLAGVAMDLSINQYATFSDLWLYCYRVASVVGLLSMGILGYGDHAEPYAIKQGVALQLTNILRDVGEDARRGRVYLPREDLARWGLSTEDIFNEVYNEQFCNMMRFEIDRTYRLYDESWLGIALLPSESRLAVGVAASVYRGILKKIERNHYDAYRYRAHLTSAEKFLMLPRIWYRIHQLGRER